MDASYYFLKDPSRLHCNLSYLLMFILSLHFPVVEPVDQLAAPCRCGRLSFPHIA